jgi:23S rRNA pseudoU1915 N3-methylase RlmH
VEEAELVHSDQTEEEIAKKRSEAAKASVEPKDNVNNLELKTEESRSLNFPSNFADWSEDQKKDAYNNNFKLSVQKYY